MSILFSPRCGEGQTIHGPNQIYWQRSIPWCSAVLMWARLGMILLTLTNKVVWAGWELD